MQPMAHTLSHAAQAHQNGSRALDSYFSESLHLGILKRSQKDKVESGLSTGKQWDTPASKIQTQKTEALLGKGLSFASDPALGCLLESCKF